MRDRECGGVWILCVGRDREEVCGEGVCVLGERECLLVEREGVCVWGECEDREREFLLGRE